jgi:chaperonin GroEL
MLVTKANREKIQVAIVKAPGMSTTARMDALEDLAFLTGGRPVLKAAGDRLDKVRLEHLGRARRTWADLRDFGINGGRGNPRVLRQHIATLRQTYRSATSVEDRRRLLERLGKLMGGAATLYVGGISTGAVDARVELATRTAEAMRGAIREGVVPGGGSALLACRAALLANAEPRGCPDDAERRAAYTILARAMEEPARALLANAGCETGAVLGHIFTEIEQGGPGYGYDVAGGQVAQMSAAGIVDSASVVKSAVHSAISSAALLLTTDVIIHLKNPPEQINT